MAPNFRRPTESFQERLAQQAERMKAEAEKIPRGRDRDALLNRAQQFEVAADMDRLLSSPGFDRLNR